MTGMAISGDQNTSAANQAQKKLECIEIEMARDPIHGPFRYRFACKNLRLDSRRRWWCCTSRGINPVGYGSVWCRLNLQPNLALFRAGGIVVPGFVRHLMLNRN